MDCLKIVLFLCVFMSTHSEPLNSTKSELKKDTKDPFKGVSCRDRVAGLFPRDIDISGKCKKGQIRWTLTKKDLNMSFNTPESRELCFISRAPKGLERYTVYKVQDKKLDQIGTPRKGFDSCTTINKGKTTIRINPYSVYYGVYIRYTMVPIETTKQ